MTNPIKAPRPCTLWGQTFDSNLVGSVDWYYFEDGGIEITVEDYIGNTLASLNINELEDKQLEAVTVKAKTQEAIQAIASAQRPWLKAEGFEFVQDEVYMLLNKDGGFAIGTPYLDTDDPIFLVCDSKRNTFDNYIDFQEIVAFKPIRDSQEAWDAVAHVEVWEVK